MKSPVPDRNKEIVKLHLAGMPVKVIASRFGISRVRVYQITDRALRAGKYEARP